MQLRYDDSLNPVDHERTVFGHERNLAHVHFLLLNVFDRLIRRIFVINNKAHFNPQRGSISYASGLTLFNVKHRLT